MPKIVVIGGTFVDVALKCSQTPAPGESVTGSTLAYTVTGPGPNQAVQAALCGCEVYLVSKVGGDPFAQTARESLAEFGVNTECLFSAEAKNTGLTFTLVNAEGENASCIYTGANNALAERDIAAAEQYIAQADVCLIHGRLAQEAVVAAIRSAKVHGRKVILNPARPVEQADEQNAAVPVDYFTVDVLLSNLYEAADITDQSSANVRTAKLIGSDLVTRGVETAVITMGKRGCMVVDRSGADHIGAFEIELVDQTARGDAFAGALAACYAAKNDVREAARFAAAAGALACTKFGSIESLPAKAEIIQLLQREDMS